jgi:hypothetical protein
MPLWHGDAACLSALARFASSLDQIIGQAILAFFSYPDQDKLYHMFVCGWWFIRLLFQKPQQHEAIKELLTGPKKVVSKEVLKMFLPADRPSCITPLAQIFTHSEAGSITGASDDFLQAVRDEQTVVQPFSAGFYPHPLFNQSPSGATSLLAQDRARGMKAVVCPLCSQPLQL